MPNSLIGSVKIDPPTVRPGQPVLVQVCDPNGQPYTDNSDALITIQGVEASARYYQFVAPGNKKLTVRAVKGNIDETTVVVVPVSGAPMTYRRTLGVPAQTELPIIQASLKLGNPYLATFSLSTPSSAQPLLAGQNSQPPASAPAQAPAAPASLNPGFTEFAMALANISPVSAALRPATGVTVKPPSKATVSGSLGRLLDIPIRPATAVTSYKWDFGDGTTLITDAPTATHDYFPAIQAQKVAHSFNVSCTVAHDNLTVIRTLVLVSAYGLSKRLGTIVPYHTGETYATFQHVGFSCSMIVHNIEDQAITINRMAVVPVSDDPTIDPPAPHFNNMKVPVTIPPHSAMGIGVYLTAAQLGGTLGPKVSGFTVYYLGNTDAAVISFQKLSLRAAAAVAPSRMPFAVAAASPHSAGIIRPPAPLLPQPDVRFSRTFRIRLTDAGRASTLTPLPVEWNHGSALQAISAVATDATSGISRPGGQVIDPATNTVAVALASRVPDAATASQLQSSVRAGLGSIATAAGAIATRGSLPVQLSRTTAIRMFEGPPPANPVIAEGNICDPDNISDADAAAAQAEGLACQLTNVTEQVLMPGSFQNALKGDVILSPGQDSADNLIGALLRALTPPQYHSHSGLMTKNYYEITHCTASPDRMTASNNLQGPGGALGIKPEILQFAWPGSITQPLDDPNSGGGAVSGQRWNDPADPSGNTYYNIQGFNPEPLGIEGGNGFELVSPMVVKPLPENEPTARPLLRKAADIASARGARVDTKGNLVKQGGCYYCFYCFTKPEIAAGFADPAPASAGWAQSSSPAVCSSFVWLCMKAASINLVGPNAIETVSELSPEALAEGAEVGGMTLDGLFYYSQSQRQQAGQVLNSIIYTQAQEHEGFAQYIPYLGADLAQNIADQVLNMFAFNDPNMYGSSAWQNPGDGNAVSPDNIKWWNPPGFGYAEPLQYLEQHVEQYTISRWQKVTAYGTISGRVTRQDNGQPVSGAHVSLNDSLQTISAPDGTFKIANVPTGSYDLKAWAVVSMNGAQVQLANGSNGPAGQGETITTTPTNPNLYKDVVLEALPVNFRRLDLQFQWSSDHGDANPWHNHGVRYEGPTSASIPLGPGINGLGNTGTYSYSYDYDGQGLFRCRYDFTAALLEDLSIQVTLTGRMIDDGSNNEQTEYTINFNVPMNGQNAGWWITLENSNGYHNGPATIVGTATNSQLTG